MPVSQYNLPHDNDHPSRHVFGAYKRPASYFRFWITPVGALVALFSLWLTSADDQLAASSGWQIVLGPFGYDVPNFPGSQPELFMLLWLVSFTAFLLLGVGIGRFLALRLWWLRIWTGVFACGSLAIMGMLLLHGDRFLYFWMITIGLVLATLGLLAHNSQKYVTRIENGMQVYEHSSRWQGRAHMSRRAVLLSLGGLLGVGGVGAWLDALLVERSLQAHAFRISIPATGSMVESYSAQSLSWSPDGKYLATNIGGRLVAWEVTPELRQSVSYDATAQNEYTSVAWSPDGRLLAATSYSINYAGIGTVSLWDAQTGKQLFLGLPQPPDTESALIAWSPDSSRLAGAGTALYIWDATSSSLLMTYDDSSSSQSSVGGISVGTVAWSPDGRLLATIDGVSNGFVDGGSTLTFWDVQSGMRVATHAFDQVRQGSLLDIAWAPDSRRLALAFNPSLIQYDNSSDVEDIRYPVVVWDVSTQKSVLSCWGHYGGSNCVAWSPNGEYLAAGGYDFDVQVWNARTGERVFIYQGHTRLPVCVTWSPDGKSIASADEGNRILIWDAPV